MTDIPFTKDEFKTALEVQSKATEQMVLIASSLKEITVELKEVHDRLSNGAVSDIVEGVTTNYANVHKETIAKLDRVVENQNIIKNQLTECQASRPIVFSETMRNSSIAKDIEHVKWFIGIVGVIIVVATVILRGLDTHSVVDAQTKTLSHMLEEHIKQTEPLIELTKK